MQKADRVTYRILLGSGMIPQEKLDRLQAEADELHISLSSQIVRSGVLQEKMMLELFANQSGSRCVDIKEMAVDEALLKNIPVKVVWYYRFFPLALNNRKLTIAVSQPFDLHTLDEIRFGLGYEVEMVFTSEKDIENKLKQHYGLAAETVDQILKGKQTFEKKVPGAQAHEIEEEIEKLAETASVVQLVNQIILDAYRRRASDIHIEPYRGKVRLRYRIDGNLQETRVPPEMNQFLMPILTRFKIMANLNIVERRMPQDGKARVKTQDQPLNLRISSIPTPHGESIVVRILPTKMITSLEDLGFDRENLKIFRELIRRPFGIIFVTGPTGSGKSTTLYAALHELNGPKTKIVTLEDPIEYEMEDIVQMQVAPEIDLTFARGLRSMLRHDPDIMMVGEVRDFETADIAIRVSLTGHLILSTLHTNDASSGVTRLLDIGVEPYLISSSVNAFIGQRLVRRICPACKEEDQSSLQEIKGLIAKDLKLKDFETIKIFRGKGCEECQGTGYSGRIAVHEVMILDDEMRSLILRKTPAETLKVKAIKKGMTTLRQDAWRKVIEGITTVEEVLQATPADHGLGARVPKTEKVDSAAFLSPESLARGEPSKELDTGGGADRRKYVRVDIELGVIFRAIEAEGKGESIAPGPAGAVA
ncbi:MAG: GspE/PulE family protein, partial [Candidatus Omnitrophota bacterium]